MRRRAIALAALLVGGGCVQRVGTKYEPERRRVCADKRCFRVGALPGDFRLVHEEEGSVGFFSDARGGVIEAKATCRDDAEATPLSSLTNQLLIGYTDRRVRFAAPEPMAGREALHTVVDVRLDGVPMVLDVYVLKRDGCIFDLSYAAPPDRFEAGRPAFAGFVAGFADENGGS